MLTGAASALFAQALFGTLVGTVVDQSGSSLPKASIAVTNTGTNQRWDVMANEFGGFTLNTVPPGNYDVKVTAPGFRAYRKSETLSAR